MRSNCLVGLALLAIAEPSVAQNQINWGLLNQPTTNPGNSFMESFERARQMREAEEQRRLILQQQEAQRQQAVAEQQAQANAAQYELDQRSLDKRVGEMIAGGDCSGALDLALRSGNIPLANQVKGFCSK